RISRREALGFGAVGTAFGHRCGLRPRRAQRGEIARRYINSETGAASLATENRDLPPLPRRSLPRPRREEAARMRWAASDAKEHIWTLIGEQTKARRAHVVPISEIACAILFGSQGGRTGTARGGCTEIGRDRRR